MTRLSVVSIVGLLVAVAFVACQGADVGNDGGLVGGNCRDDRDCAERCVEGGDFPGGTCTVNCRDDYDCPETTYCVDKKGGVCLLACGGDRDCRGSYDCKNTDREGAGGKVHVCIH